MAVKAIHVKKYNHPTYAMMPYDVKFPHDSSPSEFSVEHYAYYFTTKNFHIKLC